jgi:hypothetical protein
MSSGHLVKITACGRTKLLNKTMIKFFRRIRQNMIKENRASKYLLYAIGEIILVVIGILIAVQINNSNIKRIDKISEIKYLNNIKLDLEKDLENLNYNLDFRHKKLVGTKKLIEQINGLQIEDLTELTFNVLNTLYAERFRPSNVTYNDLVSSGNLNLISNDSIKLLLFDLALLYQDNTFFIEHETSEYEEYISKPIYKFTDIDRMKPVFLGNKTAEEVNIIEDDFKELFQSKEYKNGCVVSNWTTEGFIELFQTIKSKSKQIIDLIDNELNYD